MLFEWDDDKHAETVAARGIGFDAGALIFAGPVIEWLDERRAYGEVRVRAVGMAEEMVLHVVYTDRDEVRRIISVRKANPREREAWQRRG
jgi:uncharacterized DUF497 family protein